ncbi:MAG: hypothetical protein U9R25_13850 [Chloroflexota bacterium]|nr:hypothetical protein [Chloroflexota bacterium]
MERPGAVLSASVRLPAGPTLEIFQYDHFEERTVPAANQLGFAHIAFAVDDVETALALVVTEGGSALGETVAVQIPGAGTITLVYATDPEDNIIELQRWSNST